MQFGNESIAKSLLDAVFTTGGSSKIGSDFTFLGAGVHRAAYLSHEDELVYKVGSNIVNEQEVYTRIALSKHFQGHPDIIIPQVGFPISNNTEVVTTELAQGRLLKSIPVIERVPFRRQLMIAYQTLVDCHAENVFLDTDAGKVTLIDMEEEAIRFNIGSTARFEGLMMEFE